MIARHWRGWTKLQDVDVYEELITTKVLPELKKIKGYRGGYVLRSDAEESEFVVLNLFQDPYGSTVRMGAETSSV